MKILLTGASGFLGKAINRSHFVRGQSEVVTLGRNQSQINCDLAYQVPELPQVDLVIHAAGKAHSVPKTEVDGLEFFKVNVDGTKNLLKGLENALPAAFVFISSVSVYGVTEGNLIAEDAPLKAADPYGLSKIRAEELVQQWCKTHDVVCTIFRLPLIAGYNPPGNLKSMIKAIEKGFYLNIAQGKARKSIVLAEDVAKIISVASHIGGIFNLADGYHPSFAELSNLISKQLRKSEPHNIPGWFAKFIARAGDLVGSKAPINSSKLRKITSDLTFDDSKARRELGWNPTPVLEGFKIK